VKILQICDVFAIIIPYFSGAAGLARKYSTDTSAEFVNGVLAGVIN
jgi:hypothetical protein